MKLFRFHGGVHPNDHKRLTASKPISLLPIPQRLYLPLQQHIGAPAEPVVNIGETVLKGQLLAHSQGHISAPVHAPTSGTILDIGPLTAPHPSGLPIRTVTLESDGTDQWTPALEEAIRDPLILDPEEISNRVGTAGIVGMGGATFPSAVKLKLSLKRKIHTLIINGGECEPYLTCDDRLMQERPAQIADGIRIILHAVQAERAIIAIENNKPAAIVAMKATCAHLADTQVIVVPAQYPMGSEKHLIQTLLGQEVPAGGLGADIGVLVHNVGTAYAVHRTIRYHIPLISRIVTVSGDAIRNPQNVEVPIGTPLSDVIQHCGGFKTTPARLLMGGPMMGNMINNLNIPVVKGTSGIVALTSQALTQQLPKPCIRCGRCVDSCPCGLVPLEMAAHIRKDNLEKAAELGLVDCVACGCCSYSCPAHIPLVQYFNYAKGALFNRQQTKHRSEETRKLIEQRKSRLAKEEEAKKLAALKRKAEKDAQKKSLKSQADEEIAS